VVDEPEEDMGQLTMLMVAGRYSVKAENVLEK
jgi:hypothetical protein